MSDYRLKVISEITKPSERDKQKRIGPSDIGNPCDKCLGRAMMDERAEQDFSLYPWLGTGNHLYMEQETFPDYEHEMKLYVGDVEGYGPIKGTTDMYDKDEKAAVDWKFVGAKKIKQYRTGGVSDQYRFQAMTYARGIEMLGLPIEKICIVFIPRDSGNVKDIWVHEEEYQPEMAAAALDRATQIWAFLQEEGNTWRDLEEDDNCFQCNYMW